MSDYDASIKISTKVDIKSAEVQLSTLENRIVKTSDKIVSLRTKMDALKSAKIPTQEYKDITSDISKAEKELGKLIEKQSQMQLEGKNSGAAWDRINQKIQATNEYIEYAKSELQELVTAGKAFTIGDPAESEKISQQLQYEETNLSNMLQKRTLLNSKIQEQADEEQRLAAIKENATIADQELVELIERRKQLSKEIADMEKAGVTEGYQEYDTALADLSDVQGQINSIRELRDGASEARASYVRLGDAVKQSFKMIAKNVAVRSFRILGNSIRSALSKASSLIGSMAVGLKNLGSTAKKSFSTMNKSAKKSNGIFSTFSSRLKGIALSLLVFNWITKAFNGVVKSIKDGFGNLYKDNEKFKKSVDELNASVLTLKNAFAAAFRPLVDIAIPYIQKAADYMTDLLDRVGQFTAAITGQKTYTRAIRQTADAFKEAEKAVEGYLSPLDEINKFSTSKDKDEKDPTGVMFEELPVTQKFKDMADKAKEIFKDLFSPIKEAWDREGDFVIDSWKYGLKEIGKLLKDIGRDFLKVWNQPETIKILENILHIIGDIGLVVGNLAAKFREAWNENDTGLHILENIRDIIGVIVANIRHAADATMEWSRNLDFLPLLTKVQEWTASLVPVFDTLSGIITDFYEKVLLPLGTWTIEKGLPDLLQVLINFNNMVDWEGLRTRLAEFWEHLEPFAEVVGEGLIIFIGRLSEALAGFLNSPALSEFLTMIENWMDNVSPEEVADGFQKIAIAIIALKAAGSALTFISTNFSMLSAAASILKGTLSLLPGVISALSTAISFLLSPVGLLVTAIAGLVAEFVHLYKTDEEVKESIDSLYSEHIKPFIDHIVEGVQNLKEKISQFWDTYLKPALKEIEKNVKELLQEHIVPALEKVFDALDTLWKKALEPFIGWIIDTLLPVVLPIVEENINTTLELIGWLFDAIGGLANIISDAVGIIVSLLKGDWSGAWEHAGNIVKTVWDGITGTIQRAVSKIKEWINDLLSLFDKAKDKGSSVSSGSPGQSNSTRSYSARSVNIPYSVHPAIAKLSNVEIPGYATGQVIPRTMKQHLAILGDNNQETEVVSPLSTMKQAFMEAMAGMGGVGGNNQPIIVKLFLDSKVVYETVIKEGKVQQMSTGSNDFLLGAT